MRHSHSLEHSEIQRIVDAALDQPLDAEMQAALDQHLAGCAECHCYAAGLAKLGVHLGPALESRWPAQPLSDGQRASTLGKILASRRRNPMQTHISSSVRALVLGTLVLVLIVALSWGIRTLRPVSPAGGGVTPDGRMPSTQTETTPEGQTPSTPTEQTPEGQTTPSAPTEQTPEGQTMPSAPTPFVPTMTPEPPPAGSVRLFPELQFTFSENFPPCPEQVMLFQQKVSQAITPDLARQIALQLGVDGQVIQYTGEGGGPIYEVHGGGSVVRFLGYADQYVYEVIPNAGFENPADLPPFDQQVTIAEAFLRQKGLLRGTYRTEPVTGDPGVVRFVQLLDNRMVRYGVGDGRMASPSQWIDVSVNARSEVSTVSYYAHYFQDAGHYPILDAQQAWERFSANGTGGYGMYAILSAERPVTYRSWVRDYPVGTVHIYDYAVASQSAEGEATLIQFSHYPVSGNVQGMVAGKFLHAWGQIVLDEQARKTFLVEGWEISPLADTNLSGTIQRQGDAATLQSDDGQWLALPELPAEVSEGVQVDIRGVVLNGALDWSYIQTGEFPTYYSSMLSCGGGGGGSSETPDADFGGGAFANLELAGMSAAPSQFASSYPYQTGDVIDGQIGNVWVTIHQYADYTEVEAAMWVEASDGMTYVAHVSGAGLGGIENFNALPIKVWGRVERVADGEMYFIVDRYAEAYPGLRIQAWIGTEKAVGLEGKDVLLFTTLDGQQFVLKASISYGDAVRIGRVGDTVIREGLLLPDVTFGGYPVVQDLAGQMANGQTDLSGYTITSGQPSIIDHTQDVPVVSPASIVQGQVTIEKIELVYVGYSLAGCPAIFGNNNPATLYVQPVWRFTGQFEDGRRFEVLVQALPDNYLTFGMPGG